MRSPFCRTHRWTMTRDEQRAWFRCPPGGEVLTDEAQARGRTVAVKFEVEDGFTPKMRLAAEQLRGISYRSMLINEHAEARAHVGELLDQLCRDYGLNHDLAWRFPRFCDQEAADGRPLSAETRTLIEDALEGTPR